MSDFVFIIPPGWTEVSAEVVGLIGSIMGDLITIGNYPQITEILKSYAVVPEEMNVYEAKFFDDMLVVRMA